MQVVHMSLGAAAVCGHKMDGQEGSQGRCDLIQVDYLPHQLLEATKTARLQNSLVGYIAAAVLISGDRRVDKR